MYVTVIYLVLLSDAESVISIYDEDLFIKLFSVNSYLIISDAVITNPTILLLCLSRNVQDGFVLDKISQHTVVV